MNSGNRDSLKVSALSFDSPSTSSQGSKSNFESLEEYEKELEKLDKLHFQKRVEKRVLQNCINNIQVAEFLYDHVFNPSYGEDEDESEGFISKDEREFIKQLLLEKEEVSRSAAKISKENRDLERRILKKRKTLKESIEKRNSLWNKAAKIYESSSPENVADIEKSDFDESSTLHSKLSALHLDSQDPVSNEYKMVKQEILAKATRISKLAEILHKLISFSGVKWSDNKHLLEILYCTGNLLGSEFDVKNPKGLKKITDDVIHRLNSVKKGAV